MFSCFPTETIALIISFTDLRTLISFVQTCKCAVLLLEQDTSFRDIYTLFSLKRLISHYHREDRDLNHIDVYLTIFDNFPRKIVLELLRCIPYNHWLPNLPLFAAAFRGIIEYVEICGEKGSEDYWTNAIEYAAYGGHLDMVKYCAAQKTQWSETHSSHFYWEPALFAAASAGHMHIVEHCTHIRPWIDLGKALIIAAESGHFEIVEYCGERLRDKFPYYYLNCALFHALNGKYNDIVEYCVKNGASLYRYHQDPPQISKAVRYCKAKQKENYPDSTTLVNLIDMVNINKSSI